MPNKVGSINTRMRHATVQAPSNRGTYITMGQSTLHQQNRIGNVPQKAGGSYEEPSDKEASAPRLSTFVSSRFKVLGAALIVQDRCCLFHSSLLQLSGIHLSPAQNAYQVLFPPRRLLRVVDHQHRKSYTPSSHKSSLEKMLWHQHQHSRLPVDIPTNFPNVLSRIRRRSWRGSRRYY